VTNAAELPAVSNADNGGLLPTVTGLIDEVNGKGAVEVPDFIATRHELVQVAKYWAGISVREQWWWLRKGSINDSHRRLLTYAERRLARLVNLLGADEVARAVDEANSQFGADKDPEDWKVFMQGDHNQIGCSK